MIVSEESGGISIAVGGQVERVTPERLRTRLGELLLRYAPQSALSFPIPSVDDETYAPGEVCDLPLTERPCKGDEQP